MTASSLGCVAATGSPTASPTRAVRASGRVVRKPSLNFGATGAGPNPPLLPPLLPDEVLRVVTLIVTTVVVSIAVSGLPKSFLLSLTDTEKV